MTEPVSHVPADAGRRRALGWLVGTFLSLWGFAAAGVGILFLKAPEKERSPVAAQVRCGALTGLPVGHARFFPHGAEPLILVRESDTEVVALSAICTHMRCVLQWDPEGRSIRCPCHDGSFDRHGNVLSGPPSRPLPRYACEVRAGEIIVRTGRTV